MGNDFHNDFFGKIFVKIFIVCEGLKLGTTFNISFQAKNDAHLTVQFL